MGPHTVGDRLGEIWVPRLGHPVREDIAPVLLLAECRRYRPQRPRRLRLLGPWIFQILACLGHHAHRPGGQLLAPHPREEPRQPEIIRLAPPFRGMVVALRALDPHSQKQLAHRSGQRFRVVQRLEKRRRRFAGAVSPRRHDLPRELVVGRIVPELPSQPPRNRHRPLRPDRVPVHPQQVTPLHRPEISVFRALQQTVDHPGPLVRPAVRQKLPGLRGCRQRADGVEIHPPQEGRIIHHPARRNAQKRQLVPHMPVHQVVFRRSGETVPRSGQRHPAHGHIPHMAHQNRGLTRVLPGL